MNSIFAPRPPGVSAGHWRSRRSRAQAARKPILLVALWPAVALNDTLAPRPVTRSVAPSSEARLPPRVAIPLILLLSGVGWAGLIAGARLFFRLM